MRRNENSNIHKKGIIIAVAIVLLVGLVFVMKYSPKQEIEVGEYKNYQIK